MKIIVERQEIIHFYRVLLQNYEWNWIQIKNGTVFN